MGKSEGTRRGNAEGTLEQLPSGKWRSRVTAGGRRHSITAVTKDELRRKVRALLANADRGMLPAVEKLTLGQLAERWLADVVRHGSRPRTHEFYTGVLERYVLPDLGKVRLERLQTADVQRVYARLLDRGLSPKTVRHAHRTLYTLLEQAVTWGLAARNVAHAASPPSVERREAGSFTPEQVKTILAAPPDRRQALALVAVTTGLRQGELLALRWADVDLEGATLRVGRQLGRDGAYSAPKTARGRRAVDLLPATVAALREHRKRQLEARLLAGSEWEDHDLVFSTWQGKPLGHRNAHREWKLLLAVLGLPALPFHAARHTYATHALASGSPVGDVSRQLGHATTSMTLDTYGHAIPEAGRGVAARLSALYA